MSDNYPDIAKLMAEANDTVLGWEELQPEMREMEAERHKPEEAGSPPVEVLSDQNEQKTDSPETAKESPILSTMPLEELERYFEDFVEAVSTKYTPLDKGRRVFCQLDRDVVDSLDECDINGRCRSDIVNAILRQFIKTFLPQLSEYKRNRQSFFDNLKDK